MEWYARADSNGRPSPPEPRGEVSHQRRHPRGRWEGMPPGLGEDAPRQTGIVPGDLRLGAPDHERLQIADVGFRHERGLPAELADIAHSRIAENGRKTEEDLYKIRHRAADKLSE